MGHRSNAEPFIELRPLKYPCDALPIGERKIRFRNVVLTIAKTGRVDSYVLGTLGIGLVCSASNIPFRAYQNQATY